MRNVQNVLPTLEKRTYTEHEKHKLVASELIAKTQCVCFMIYVLIFPTYPFVFFGSDMRSISSRLFYLDFCRFRLRNRSRYISRQTLY